MRTPIVKLFALIVVLFALLIGWTTRWTVFEAGSLNDNNLNKRTLFAELRTHGGRILANPKVHRLFYGDYWTQAAHTAEAADYDTTWTNLASDPSFYTRLSEYGVGVGSSPP